MPECKMPGGAHPTHRVSSGQKYPGGKAKGLGGSAPLTRLRSDFLTFFQKIVDQLALQGAAIAAAILKRAAGI